MSKFLKILGETAWYLLIVFAVLQFISVIVMAFFDPNIAKSLITIIISLLVGLGIGYLLGKDSK